MSKIIMNREDFVEVLTLALYELDPATTYCNMNDMFDEYANEANHVAGLFIGNNMPFKLALFEVFDEYFSGAYNEELLNEVFLNVNERMC